MMKKLIPIYQFILLSIVTFLWNISFVNAGDDDTKKLVSPKDVAIAMAGVTVLPGSTTETEQPKQSSNEYETDEAYRAFCALFAETEEMNVTDVLWKNCQQQMEFRDKVYGNEYRNKNLKVNDMTDSQKLKIIGKVVNHLYTTVHQPDNYTKVTDLKHFKEISYLSAKEWQQLYPNENVPITLIIAGWFHDIERYIPAVQRKQISPDFKNATRYTEADTLRKQVAHPLMSKKVAMVMLDGAPLTVEEKETILYLIHHHEVSITTSITVDGIEYLSKPDKHLKQLAVLIDADALAFFESTIKLFILDRKHKEKKGKLWDRIMKNLKRLNPRLQPYAIEKIRQLPIECQTDVFPEDWQQILDMQLQSIQVTNKNMEQYLKDMFQELDEEEEEEAGQVVNRLPHVNTQESLESPQGITPESVRSHASPVVKTLFLKMDDLQ